MILYISAAITIACANYFALAGIAMIRWLWTFRPVDFWKSKLIRTQRILTHTLEISYGIPRISRNTSTKRFPIFSLRKRIYPWRPCLFGQEELRWERAVCASLRHPIISHDLIFTTRNTKLAFHLRELQFAAFARHLRRPFLFSVHSFPFIPSRVIRFLSAEPSRSVTFQSVPAVLGPYQLYYVFASSFLHHFYRLRRASASSFVLRGMKSAKGRGESRWKGQWSTSADHVIILSCCKATQNETFKFLHSRIASTVRYKTGNVADSANEKKSWNTDHQRNWFV